MIGVKMWGCKMVIKCGSDGNELEQNLVWGRNSMYVIDRMCEFELVDGIY
jgi:hypothetical protein